MNGKRRASVNASQMMKTKKKKVQRKKALNSSILENSTTSSKPAPVPNFQQNPAPPSLPQPDFSPNFDPYILQAEEPIFSPIDPHNIDLANPSSFETPIILAPNSESSIIYDFENTPREQGRHPVATSTPNDAATTSTTTTTSTTSTTTSTISQSSPTANELKKLKKEARAHKRKLKVGQKTQLTLFVIKEQEGDDRAVKTFLKHGRKKATDKLPVSIGHRSVEDLIKEFYENEFPILYNHWDINFNKICPIKSRDILKWKRNLNKYGCVEPSLIEAGIGIPLNVGADDIDSDSRDDLE